MRVLALAVVGAFVLVSGTFNYLFSATLGDGAEHYAWVMLGFGAACYSALGFDISRANFKQGAYFKALAALVLLAAAVAWDARCHYGYANIQQESARRHLADEERKRASATAKAADARKSLEPYITALDPIEADAAVDVLARRINDQRCAAKWLSKDDRELCDALSEARIAAARAHAKGRFTKALEEAEAVLNASKAPPPRDALAELIGPERAKWLPAIVLQLGTLLGVFAASIPRAPRKPAPMPPKAPELRAGGQTARRAPGTPPQHLPPLPLQQAAIDTIVSIVARLLAEPEARPPGVVVDADGWLAGPQRRLATLLRMPVSKVNRELKAAVQSGAIEMSTRGRVTRLRVPTTRH